MKPTVPRYAPWSDRSCSRKFRPGEGRLISEAAHDPSGKVRLNYDRQPYVEFQRIRSAESFGWDRVEVHPIGRGLCSWPVFLDGRWCWHLNPDGHRSWTHKPNTADQQGNVSRSWGGPLNATLHGYHGTKSFVLTCPELGYRQREVATFAGKTLNDATPEEIAEALTAATALMLEEATIAVDRLRAGIRKLR